MPYQTPRASVTRVLPMQLFNGDGNSAGQSLIVTATIALGESLSVAVDLASSRLAAILIPSDWTAAAITYQVSLDGVNYGDLYDGATEASISSASVVAGRVLRLPRSEWAGVRYLKIRSGTSAAPVSQVAERILTLGVYA